MSVIHSFQFIIVQQESIGKAHKENHNQIDDQLDRGT